MRERESSLHSSLQQSLQSSALQRDVKGLGDAQARLVRVIEDISQELTQRLAKHDLQLEQLVEKQQSLQEAGVVIKPSGGFYVKVRKEVFFLC